MDIAIAFAAASLAVLMGCAVVLYLGMWAAAELLAWWETKDKGGIQ
jgi:hypothetical protein